MERQSQCLAQRTEVLFDQIAGEAVVPRGHRRVGRENHLARHAWERVLEHEAFFLHARANGLEDGEDAVALVEVQDPGGDTHRPERTEPADAEQQLLADADASITAIQPRRELAVLG